MWEGTKRGAQASIGHRRQNMSEEPGDQGQESCKHQTAEQGHRAAGSPIFHRRGESEESTKERDRSLSTGSDGG
eukprot:13470459-Alexandrium_andersonii.AAC.1